MSDEKVSKKRGFNDNIVVFNLNKGDSTIIARRFMKNYLHVNAKEPYTNQIKNKLMKPVKWARQRYQIDL